MSVFVAQVKNANAAGRTDINRNAETVLIPLLTEVYGYKNIKNLNITEGANYPGIDLGDESARVAFQITSTPSIDKVKDTLQKFADYELYKKYDRLIIYILTERQKSYSEAACKSIIQGRFAFNLDEDVLDCRNILRIVGGFQIDKLHRIQNILEANFGEHGTPLFLQTEEQFTENLHVNLLELFFPQTLYVADLDRELALKSSEHGKVRNGRKAPRKTIRNALHQRELKFAVDWEYFRNQIFTFHDLCDPELPLAQIVDKDTVTPIHPEKFYSVDEHHERAFKTLLGRCLQQKLYHQRVLWQNEDQLYIFADVDEEAIRSEQWHGERESRRRVYERVMKDNKPDQILHCKHLAFRTQYKRFGNSWYLLIKPEWFFSFDGYHRSFYGSKNIDWLKRHENNSKVYNHLRFIAHYLTYEKPPDLLVERSTYPFLTFGELLSLDSALDLDDKNWIPPRIQEEDETSIFDL